MKICLLHLLALSYLVFSPLALAVDEARIWLPKKYNDVKPKLMAAATQAEQTERCKRVVAGEMIVRKNTPEYYYFVVTCRDKNFKTYNLTFHYPVTGAAAKLVAEQRSKEEQRKQTNVEVEETGVNAEQALQLCRNAVTKATDALDEVVVTEQGISHRAEAGGVFSYILPFSAQSDLGSDVNYRAECLVSKEGKAQVVVHLENAGALAICRDTLRSEAILLGRLNVDEGSIVDMSGQEGEGFRYQLGFDIKNRIGTVIRYGAECSVGADGEGEITILLLSAGALAICKDELGSETLLMKSVEIAEKPSAESTRAAGGFHFEIPFIANDPDGSRRNFKAYCEVNEDGEADVVTEIDRDAIIAVCIKDLRKKTTKMIGVTVLEDQVPALKEEENGGFVGIVPFNARSPEGRELHYQAECRVDGSGRSRIKLGVRKGNLR